LSGLGGTPSIAASRSESAGAAAKLGENAQFERGEQGLRSMKP
jgi:hypothetical protein